MTVGCPDVGYSQVTENVEASVPTFAFPCKNPARARHLHYTVSQKATFVKHYLTSQSGRFPTCLRTRKMAVQILAVLTWTLIVVICAGFSRDTGDRLGRRVGANQRT